MIRVLFDVNMLIDTDIGMINFVKKTPKLNKPVLFNTGLLSRYTPSELTSFLVKRKCFNPLDAIASEKTVGKWDGIYQEIKEDKNIYSKVLSMSRTTAIYDLFIAGNNIAGKDYVGDILYYYEAEKDYLLNTLFVPAGRLVKFEIKEDKENNKYEYMPLNYGSFYIKDYSFLLNFDINTIKGKHLYMANYEFNYNMVCGCKVPLTTVSVILGKTNTLDSVDVYRVNYKKS